MAVSTEEAKENDEMNKAQSGKLRKQVVAS
jgi:hypothetical protein